MKRAPGSIYLGVLFLICMAAAATAAPIEVRVTLTYDPDALQVNRLGAFDEVRLAGCASIPLAGAPALPVATVRVALPEGMTVSGVRLDELQAAAIQGCHPIRPAQPPRPIDATAAVPEYAVPDARIYASEAAYPPARVRLVGQCDLAGQNMAVLHVYPLQYLPGEQTLVMTTSMEVVLTGEPGYACGDYLPVAITARGREACERLVSRMVINPEDVALRTGSAAAPARGVEPGQYDYVIITSASWLESFAPLAEWRTKHGMPATLVTTDWIYTAGGYSGTNLEKIRAFIVDAHDQWGATDFLLGGDTHIIPDHIRTITVPGYWTDNIPNDTYFADYDEDWVCEVNVGRASVRSPTQIATFIDKLMTYEKNPPLAGYATSAVFFGFDISTCGDAYGETHKENFIRSQHLPPSWSFDTEYDSEPGSHHADVLAYLQAGYHLVNHHDHCNSDCMGTGWICHGETMYTSDLSALTNGDRQSILFAVGCYPCNIPIHTSVAEGFVRNPNGGGVVFMGNSRTGWGGSIEDPDWYSARQDHFFYRNLFDYGIVRLGENFTLLKNDEFDFDDPYNLHKYCFTQLHLLGDPGMPVWTDDPRALTVVHDENVPVGPPVVFEVDVSTDGVPVDGATVCLWKEGEIYAVGATIGGMASFEITATTEGSLHVTVTGQNCVPYEGEATAEIDPASSPEDEEPHIARLVLGAVHPNPFFTSAQIRFAIPPGQRDAPVTLVVYNCLGQRVRTLVNGRLPAGTHTVIWDGRDEDGRELFGGLYLCELRSGKERRCQRVMVLR